MNVETVIVERKDHPTGYCVINKGDLKDSDKVLDKVPEPKKPVKKVTSND